VWLSVTYTVVGVQEMSKKCATVRAVLGTACGAQRAGGGVGGRETRIWSGTRKLGALGFKNITVGKKKQGGETAADTFGVCSGVGGLATAR